MPSWNSARFIERMERSGETAVAALSNSSCNISQNRSGTDLEKSNNTTVVLEEVECETTDSEPWDWAEIETSLPRSKAPTKNSARIMRHSRQYSLADSIRQESSNFFPRTETSRSFFARNHGPYRIAQVLVPA